MKKLVFFALILTVFTALSAFSAQTMVTKYTWIWPRFGWEISVELTFNQDSVNAYQTKARPAKNNLNFYYGHFIKNDPAVKMLAEKLQAINKQLGGDNNLLAELAITFLQMLPYNSDEVGPNKVAVCDYPFITLQRGSGTCLDKAILGVALFRELRFGTAMLYFPKVPLPGGGSDEHVALGIAANDRNYFGGFTYVELSKFSPIGQVPKVKGAGYLEEDPEAVNDQHNRQNAADLDQVLVLLKSAGKKYQL